MPTGLEETAILALIELGKMGFMYVSAQMKAAGLNEEQIHEAFLKASAILDTQDPSLIPN